MVVREDGTKWACNSCLKGHRVSGCNHTDRELKLVPKKGRPITQCQHCRQERKKRSAHVKCDCADDKTHHTKEKCIHLKEAEERAKIAGYHDDSHIDPAHLATVAEEQGCCCHHGGKCSCALLQRKDSTDDDDAVHRHKPAVKPRLETTRSDGSLTVINGHHKPIHRKNHAAHECGMPYKIPLSRSKTDQELALVARRSVDSLALDDDSKRQQQFATLPSRIDGAPKMAELLSSTDGLTSNKLNYIDFSELNPVRTNDSTASNIDGLTAFPTFDSGSDGWPLMSAEIQMPNNNPFGVWPTNADISLAQPALTAASSGTQSEIDEIPSIEDIYVRGMPIIDETAFDVIDTTNTGSPQSNRRSLPPNFFGNIDFTMPDFGEDWQDAEAGGMLNDDKSTQSFTFNDPWQNNRQAQVAGRPSALSVGASTNSGNDIIKQLFPGMDVDNAAQSSTSMNVGSDGHISPAGKAMSDIGGPFTTQAWSDGLSVPNDAFGVPFDEEDMNNQQFNSQMWNQ